MLKGIRESRIGLNFSSHGHVGIVTNRVIEVIASGTVLLSSNEDVLQKLICPESEYVYFVNELDLVNKIQDLLKNEEKMHEISKAASASISSRYSAERFVLFIESLTN
jgi:spore maturation protein CgeB